MRCITFAKINNLFDSPLPLRECETIGKSVGKWVYRNMSSQGFLEWAEKRRQKSIEVRSQRSQDRRSEALLLRSQGLKQSEIAERLNLNQSQVSRLLK